MSEVKTERPKPKLIVQAPSDAEKLKLAMELLELLVASAGQVGRRKIVLEVTRAARKLLAAESAARRRAA